MFDNPKLYHELAEWFHLLTAPAEYAEEAEFYTRKLIEACDRLGLERVGPHWEIYGHFNAPGDEEVEIYYLVRSDGSPVL